MGNNSLLQSASDVSDVDRSILKISIVIAAAVLTAGFSSFFFGIGGFVYGAILAVLFLVIFILQNLFIKSLDKLFLAALLETAALALPFYQNFSGYFVIAASVLAVLLFKASFDSRRELEATIKVRFFRISRLSLNLTIPALALFIVVMFVIKGGLWTENSLRTLLQPITPLAAKHIPTFSFSMQTGELLSDIVVSNLSEQEINDLNKLPLWAQNQLIAEPVSQIKEKIESLIMSEVDLEKPISTNIYNGLHSRYSGLNSTSRIILIAVLLVLLFSLIKSLVPFIYVPLALLAFILYEILLATNFVVVQLESRSREVIILK